MTAKTVKYRAELDIGKSVTLQQTPFTIQVWKGKSYLGRLEITANQVEWFKGKGRKAMFSKEWADLVGLLESTS